MDYIVLCSDRKKTHYIHLSLPQLYNVRFNFTITLISILKDKLMHKISVTTCSVVSDGMLNALCHLDFILIIMLNFNRSKLQTDK